MSKCLLRQSFNNDFQIFQNLKPAQDGFLMDGLRLFNSGGGAYWPENIKLAQGGFHRGGFDGYFVKSGEFWVRRWNPIFQMVIIIILSLF